MTQQPILVVDDDPILRGALARILRAEGLTVVEAADEEAAVSLAREHVPRVVVLDDSRPGLDGEGLLHRLRADLREQAPRTVLLTTGHHPEARAAALGVFGLCKPFRVEDLLDALDAHRPLVE
ncbi:MAG: response regulator [Myxococcales bacterium]|nr:response regulator [Myxococcales bacterium]